MALQPTHELHGRRLGRNLGVGLALALFIALVFGLTIVKVSRGGVLEGFDHTYRPTLDPATIDPAAAARGAAAPVQGGN